MLSSKDKFTVKKDLLILEPLIGVLQVREVLHGQVQLVGDHHTHQHDGVHFFEVQLVGELAQPQREGGLAQILVDNGSNIFSSKDCQKVSRKKW